MYSLQTLFLHTIVVEICPCLVHIFNDTHVCFMFGLHSRLITQLANQPGFGWNSCNIFFFFFFFQYSLMLLIC